MSLRFFIVLSTLYMQVFFCFDLTSDLDLIYTYTI